MTLFYVLLALTIILFLGFRRRAMAGVSSITPLELATALDEGAPWVVVDVRPHIYFEQGWIPGSVNWPLEEIAASLDRAAPWKERRLVLVCHSGMTAVPAVRRLKANGFADVVNLRGGVQGWRKVTGGASWNTPEDTQ